MSAAMTLGQCTRCGQHKLVGPLHLERGGPIVCIPCGSKHHADKTRRERAERMRLRLLAPALYGNAEPTELCLELLEDAIRLCHPDKHPPERQEKAQRVTAELLALKPYVRPRPPPPEARPLRPVEQVGHNQLPKPEVDPTAPGQPDGYPCKICIREVPSNYCDKCRARWEADYKKLQEVELAKRKAARDRKRMLKSFRCDTCRKFVAGRRKDSKFCSAKCKQKHHRDVTAKRGSHAEPPITGNAETSSVTGKRWPSRAHTSMGNAEATS